MFFVKAQITVGAPPISRTWQKETMSERSPRSILCSHSATNSALRRSLTLDRVWLNEKLLSTASFHQPPGVATVLPAAAQKLTS